ncbi:MAG: TIGR03960 family B12-binding radical SAM protein [Anaerolineales bacterium]|nr:TIGR03960 family B12-binding radical SAM protein [Anaerolineales bacterium]
MTNQQLIEKLEKILPNIQAPGRYTGGEYNQIVKDWNSVEIRVALFFPEIYDLGMSNLGLMILYDLINSRSDYLAERAFIPWIDMEEAMRSEGVPLYSLETKHPLSAFDILAVSLPYESLYTNLLNGLDLAGLPVFSADRTEDHPLVIAGGNAVFNPEPVSPFIDAFVIGEGEEVIIEILEKYKNSTIQRVPRQEILERLAQIEGVYIPTFYQPQYDPKGSFSHLEKINQTAPDSIRKRIVGKLPPPPTKLIVPYIDTVHNRAPLEIMRGCTRGCRFCHAGIVTRPVRERPLEEILQAMEVLIPNTGYSEISLLSLSSSDYTQIINLIQAINEQFAGRNIAISLPSLRIETVSVDLMDSLTGKRRSGFTLAPEAASERLRKIINKPISDQQLLETVREIFQHGWQTIKLYFMIGHPTETLEDVQAIAELARKVLTEGTQIIGKRAQVHIGVSTFVPKPHTPFQWVGTAPQAEITEKLEILKKEIRGRRLKLNWNDPQETHFEAWLSRGDRRMAEVIFQAWKMGAKFDAWNEHFKYQLWLDAFSQTNLAPAFYTERERSTDESFPWDHIDSGVKKSFLLQDYEWSLAGKIRPDCRGDCYACGILPAYNDLRHQNPGSLWLCPEVVR